MNTYIVEQNYFSSFIYFSLPEEPEVWKYIVVFKSVFFVLNCYVINKQMVKKQNKYVQNIENYLNLHQRFFLLF